MIFYFCLCLSLLLFKAFLTAQSVTFNQIGVITPYSGQKFAIKSKLTEWLDKMYDCCLLSMVALDVQSTPTMCHRISRFELNYSFDLYFMYWMVFAIFRTLLCRAPRVDTVDGFQGMECEVRQCSTRGD